MYVQEQTGRGEYIRKKKKVSSEIEDFVVSYLQAAWDTTIARTIYIPRIHHDLVTLDGQCVFFVDNGDSGRQAVVCERRCSKYWYLSCPRCCAITLLVTRTLDDNTVVNVSVRPQVSYAWYSLFICAGVAVEIHVVRLKYDNHHLSVKKYSMLVTTSGGHLRDILLLHTRDVHAFFRWANTVTRTAGAKTLE